MKKRTALAVVVCCLCCTTGIADARAAQPPDAVASWRSAFAALLARLLSPRSEPKPQPQPPPQPSPQPPPDDLVELPVVGFGDAAVSLPRNPVEPEPVMIAAHGHGGDPESICREWRGVVGDAGFIVCPRGVPIQPSGYSFDARLPAEVEAGIEALRSRYGLWVSFAPMIYSGYSLGAYKGPSFVMSNPARYSRVLLVEGGQRGWRPKEFAAEGGQRVLFACGQASCDSSAEETSAAFERAGVQSRVVYSPGAGHIFWGPVSAQVKEQWGWFVDGDLRWTRGQPPTIAPRPKPARVPSARNRKGVARYGGSSV